MTTYTDEDGVWEVRGNTRLLVEPSEAYLDALAANEPPRIPPAPNAYLLAAMNVFATEQDPTGLIRGNEVLSRWPTFSLALKEGNWAIARLVLTTARTTETITQVEHDALVALFSVHHIPEE